MATNKEVILGHFAFDIPEALVEKVMTDRGVSGTANYTVSTTESTDLSVADLCLHFVNNKSESEGGYSIAFDTGKMLDLRSRILKKYGLEDEENAGSTIKAKSVW